MRSKNQAPQLHTFCVEGKLNSLLFVFENLPAKNVEVSE